MIIIKTTIENATRYSRQGYIDNPDDVEKIIKRLADTPVSSFISKHTSTVLEVLAEYMEDAHMDYQRVDEVTYAEALAMLDGIVTSGIYDCNCRDWCRDSRSSTLAHFRSMMISSEDSNTALKLFMSVTVKEYLCYLASRTGLFGNNTAILYETVRLDVENYLKFSITENTTIGELLLNFDIFQIRNWLPIMPIKEFEAEIRGSYDSLYRLLIEYYQKAFKSIFNLEYLKEKYKEEN